jgi:nucleoside-diphosphate-sugar epimerase
VPLAYIDNVIDAMCLGGIQEEAVGQIYNIVDDGEITQGQYLDELIQRTALNIFSLHVPFRFMYLFASACEAQAALSKREGHFSLSRYRLISATKDVRYDTSRAKKQLGWQPNVSLQEGLRRTFEWYKSNRAAYYA